MCLEEIVHHSHLHFPSLSHPLHLSHLPPNPSFSWPFQPWPLPFCHISFPFSSVGSHVRFLFSLGLSSLFFLRLLALCTNCSPPSAVSLQQQQWMNCKVLFCIGVMLNTEQDEGFRRSLGLMWSSDIFLFHLLVESRIPFVLHNSLSLSNLHIFLCH